MYAARVRLLLTLVVATSSALPAFAAKTSAPNLPPALCKLLTAQGPLARILVAALGPKALARCAPPPAPCPTGTTGTGCSECATGFHRVTGTSTCEADETCSAGRCGDFGTCTVTSGAVQCLCLAGYSGARCELCDPYLERDGEGRCAPGPVCRDALCGGRGECVVTRGAAPSCTCDAGFAGVRCESCAPDFAFDGTTCTLPATCDGGDCRAPRGDGAGAGSCTSDDTGAIHCGCPPGRTGPTCEFDVKVAGYHVDGAYEILELGQSTWLSAEALGVGNHDELVFELVAGGGTLIPMGPGLAQYVAPSMSQEPYGVATVKIYPACCPSQGTTLDIGYKGPTMPWVTGHAKAALKPVDQALLKFMYDRCTGGLVLGLNWKGVPLYRRGYGRTSGRSTPGRVGVDCGDVDPTATPVYPDSPVRIGSNSKAVTAAMVRRAVGARLFSLGRLPPFPALPMPRPGGSKSIG